MSCSGQLDSRMERGDAYNPRGCQAAAELSVRRYMSDIEEQELKLRKLKEWP